jgi:hypothetical protein
MAYYVAIVEEEEGKAIGVWWSSSSLREKGCLAIVR